MAKALGWKFQSIAQNGTVENLNQAFEQAISDHPAIITMSGIQPAEIQKPLADAKKAGIIVSLSGANGPSTGTPQYVLTFATSTSQKLGDIQADWVMKDSKCTAHVAYFSVAGIAPNQTTADAFASTIKTNCSSCSVAVHLIQPQDLDTPTAVQAVVSALQADPSVRYVGAVFGNVADNVSAGLQQAGISGIKIFGAIPDQNSIAGLQNHTNAMWVNVSPQMLAWVAVDAALRHMETGKPVNSPFLPGVFTLTPQNVPEGSDAQTIYPTNYRKLFEHLWGVS